MSLRSAAPVQARPGAARHVATAGACRFALAFVMFAWGSVPLLAQAEFKGGPALDAAIEKAIAAHKTPGAVVLIGQPGTILYEKAYGERSIEPKHEKMTVDTIFDAASLTKVIATTSAVMRLFEQGKIRLSDRVTEYLPTFQGGKSDITIRNLMTHFSGLREDLDLKPDWTGYETGIRMALNEKSRTAPGLRFVYSDINFILLGEIVRVVSGEPLNEFVQREVFEPLGMRETRYLPPAEWRARIAPTEREHGVPLRGVVHDETARSMGGVAGHAGLFTTAEDLAKFGEMMPEFGRIQRGTPVQPADGAQIHITEHVAASAGSTRSGLGHRFAVLGQPWRALPARIVRAHGFHRHVNLDRSLDQDLRHPALQQRASRARCGSHSAARQGRNNRRRRARHRLAGQHLVHSNGNGTVGAGSRHGPHGGDLEWSGRFGSGWILETPGQAHRADHESDRLLRDHRRNLDAMLAAGVKVTALYSPEHGIEGKTDDALTVAHSKDERTGIPVWSLYLGQKPQALEGNARERRHAGVRYPGCRSEILHMGQHHEECDGGGRPCETALCGARPPKSDQWSRRRRTNSRPGSDLLHRLQSDSTAAWDDAGRVGPLDQLRDHVNANLEVIPMQNWRRDDWWDATSLAWVDPPSPNMRNFTAALLYTGVAMLEFAPDWSVGRGTVAPFEQAGAEWVRGPELSSYLNRRFIPGVRFYPTTFVPDSAALKGKVIQGVRFVIIDRETFSPIRLGLEIAAALETLYPGKIDLEKCATLIGSREVIRALRNGADPEPFWIGSALRWTSLRPEESPTCFTTSRIIELP